MTTPQFETDLAQEFYEKVKAVDPAYRVEFGPDLPKQVAAGEFALVEMIKAADPSVEIPPPLDSRHHHFDGNRLVLSLGPDDTADDTYSSIEVPNTPRFTQLLLDYLAAVGSLQVMIPGRQSVFRDVVYSDHFADGRAWKESITTGCCFQSWRGIEKVGLMPDTYRPQFVVGWLAYMSGPGLLPMATSRSLRRRSFFASVIDYNAGISWMTPVRDFDPSVPHDVAIRWLPNRDMEFLINNKRVAYYEDGKSRTYPAKLVKRQFGRGVNLRSRRFLTVDPCHLNFWMTCMTFGNLPEVLNGKKLSNELWAAIKGYGIEPLW